MSKLARLFAPVLCVLLISFNTACGGGGNKYTGEDVETPTNTGTDDNSDTGSQDKTYTLVSVVNRVHSMTEDLENNANQTTLTLLEPYKAEIDKTMNEVIGYAATSMYRGKPESALGNLVADVLRDAGETATGSPVDMGIVNLGGLRANLYEGDILRREVYEILPFDNYLCVVTLRGSVLTELMRNIASTNGAGISNCVITMDGNRNLVSATVGAQNIDENKLYTVATIDFLAEGNSGLTALTKGEKTAKYSSLNMRDLMLEYIVKETKAGRHIQAYVEGRIKVVN